MIEVEKSTFIIVLFSYFFIIFVRYQLRIAH